MAAASSRLQTWPLITGWDAWRDLLLEKSAAQHEAEVVALLLPTDRNANSQRLGLEAHPFQQFLQIKARHKLTREEFLKSIQHIDRTGSSQGIRPR